MVAEIDKGFMNMDYEKLAQANALEKEAAELRKQAFLERPLPDHWEVGQRVRYIKSSEWAYDAGRTAVIVETRQEYEDRPASDYSVFYTRPLDDNGVQVSGVKYWTPSTDVELLV